MPKERKKKSLSFLARPNMLSLDRFQSCFNSLKKVKQNHHLHPWQLAGFMCSYCSCQVKEGKKKKGVFIQLCHGSSECWKCERCQNVFITMTYSTWRQEHIMLVYWCKGSYNSPFYPQAHKNIRKHTSPARGSDLLSTESPVPSAFWSSDCFPRYTR